MIHIDLAPEPSDFDTRVRVPGNQFLARTPLPNSTQWSKHNYWNRCSNELYQAYGGICAYTGQWFPRSTTNVSVDHYLPKSRYPEKAYEWDNYRLTTSVMNNYKSDKEILYPFTIADGDFVLDFPSCLIRPRKDMVPSLKSKAQQTINILHLNDEDQASQRCEVVLDYVTGNISFSHMQKKYPYIAKEITRQALTEKIKEMMKSLTH